MTLSIISQDGTVFNYTNAVACVTCGEYEDDSGFGFMRTSTQCLSFRHEY